MRTTITVFVSSVWIVAFVACKGSPDDSGTPDHDTGQLPYPDCDYDDVAPVEVTPAEYGLSGEQIAAFENVHREHRFQVPWVGGEPGEFVLTLDVDPSKIATFNTGRTECEVRWAPLATVRMAAPGLSGESVHALDLLPPERSYEGRIYGHFQLLNNWPSPWNDSHPTAMVEPSVLEFLEGQLPAPAEYIGVHIDSTSGDAYTFQLYAQRESEPSYTSIALAEHQVP